MRRVSTDDAPRRIVNPWYFGARMEVWAIFVGTALFLAVTGALVAPWWWARLIAIPAAVPPAFLIARVIAPHLTPDTNVRYWIKSIRVETRSPRPTQQQADVVTALTPAYFIERDKQPSSVTAIDASLFNTVEKETTP
jgi:hypothetical protein